MDSLDLYRTIIAPTPSRETTDRILLDILGWVGACAPPERVFSADKLDLWATRNGYSRVGNTDLLALIREALPHIQVGNGAQDLAARMNDALYAHAG